MPRTPVDVLLVSPRTTAGWRRVDEQTTAALRDLGLSVAVAKTEFPIARHLRRTMQLTDLAEAAALRRATTRALGRHRPRAILYSGVQSTMLQPRRRLERAGLRFDALTVDNRPGRANAVQHMLERRALRRLAVLLPAGAVPASLRGDPRVVRLPIAVPVPDAVRAEREPVVLCYAGNPEKKGLDVVARAWAAAATGTHRLLVTGIEPARARAFLRARGVAEPEGLELAGRLPSARHAELLAGAEAYVSASRYEDYGIAQLEALACGTPLVTTPSAGPYEALDIAQRLEPALVAHDSSPEALATALRAAVEMPAAARAGYGERARALIAPYAEDEVRRRLEQEVLPLLLR